MRRKNLYNKLSNFDNLETSQGYTESKGIDTRLQNIRGNPNFKAQFDIKITKIYQKAGAPIAASALDATLKVSLPFTLFGLADYYANYFRHRQLMPPVIWDFSDIIIEKVAAATCPSTNVGDLIFAFTKTIGADTYDAYIIVHCSQVPYATLLKSTSSDMFIINMVRYVIPDETKINQFSNQFKIVVQTLFGKLSTDEISPQSFITPEQFQKNSADVPMLKSIDKESQIGLSTNYDCVEINQSIFCDFVEKLTLKV